MANEAIKKAFAISDAKISFVSLVDKAANKKCFLITKSADGVDTFSTFGRILKADPEKHYVTGIVYEPMSEDTQGEYMTAEEITKAAHWFMKNQGAVDLQHCFEKCEGAEVVESYVTKCDMTIEGEDIKKGTWIMTVEVEDPDVWSSIEKGDITGFSMGGTGVRSEVDVDLDVSKSEEPKGIFRKLAKALGFELVEKGEVKDQFNERYKEDNFFNAWYSLKRVLTGPEIWDPVGQCYTRKLESDESKVREALQDFTDIVTQLLASGDIIKSLSSTPISKEHGGHDVSDISTLRGIYDNLGSYISNVDKSAAENNIKKEDEEDMNAEEIRKMVGEEVKKAVEPIAKQIEALAKEDQEGQDSSGTGEAAETGGTPGSDDISKMIGDEIQKAIAPITNALEPIMKSRALPGNLNGADGSEVQKQEEHYLHGVV